MFKGQVVDKAVSRLKFEREVASFRQLESMHRERGILLHRATFPEITLYFCATKVKPAALVAAVRIDFTNYDLEPPSVSFVDPFTLKPLLTKDLGFQMLRLPQMEGADVDARRTMAAQGMPMSAMIQSTGPDSVPFICLPGIREYHDNPAHTGDSWLLHKGSGAGSLAFIADKIWCYGTNPIESFLLQIANPAIGMQLQMQIRAIGAAPALSAITV